MRIRIYSTEWLLNSFKGYTRVNNSLPVWGGSDRPHTPPPGCSTHPGLPQISQNVLHQNSRFLQKYYCMKKKIVSRLLWRCGLHAWKRIPQRNMFLSGSFSPYIHTSEVDSLVVSPRWEKPEVRLTLGSITTIVIKVAGCYWSRSDDCTIWDSHNVDR